MLDGAVPDGFFPFPSSYGKIKYDTNIMAEIPRAFKFEFENPEERGTLLTLANNPPVWNDTRHAWVLNFYG